MQWVKLRLDDKEEQVSRELGEVRLRLREGHGSVSESGPRNRQRAECPRG